MSQTHSWWVLSCLAILGRLHWIDRKKLTEFILASQDHETGGISDRPGDLPDPFHTLVSFCSVLMNTYLFKSGLISEGIFKNVKGPLFSQCRIDGSVFWPQITFLRPILK